MLGLEQVCTGMRGLKQVQEVVSAAPRVRRKGCGTGGGKRGGAGANAGGAGAASRVLRAAVRQIGGAGAGKERRRMFREVRGPQEVPAGGAINRTLAVPSPAARARPPRDRPAEERGGPVSARLCLGGAGSCLVSGNPAPAPPRAPPSTRSARAPVRLWTRADMSGPRAGFYRQELNKTVWEVPQRLQGLRPVGSGAYGSVW